jgi:predicted membrane protein
MSAQRRFSQEVSGMFFAITAIVGSLMMSLLILYFLIVYVGDWANITITMDNMGFFFVGVFIFTIFLSGLFYWVTIERQSRTRTV